MPKPIRQVIILRVACYVNVYEQEALDIGRQLYKDVHNMMNVEDAKSEPLFIEVKEATDDDLAILEQRYDKDIP